MNQLADAQTELKEARKSWKKRLKEEKKKSEKPDKLAQWPRNTFSIGWRSPKNRRSQHSPDWIFLASQPWVG